jgi:hypothetical protein
MATDVRRTLRVAPPEGVLGASELEIPIEAQKSVAYASCTTWVSQHPEPLTSTRTLADPPWIQGIVPGGKPNDVRLAPPTIGVPQHSTVVEIVDGVKPTVLIDGVPVGDGKPGKYWLPRFREQQVTTAGGKSQRDVAPVFVALRLENGATRPLAAQVHVVQRIYEDGVRVRLEDSRAEIYQLKAYSIHEATAEAVIMPYPAWITRTPSLRIIDNAAPRQHAARAHLVAGSRLWNIAAAAGRFAQSAAGDDGAVNLEGLATPLLQIWLSAESGNPVRQLWRYIFFSLLGPVGMRIYETGAALWDGVYHQYESDVPPPEPETIDIPLPDAIAAMRKIIATRSNGEHTDKDRSIGLTPAQMRKKGWKADSALFDWMVYGEAGVNQAGWIETLADPAGITTRTGEDRDGALRVFNPLGLGSRALKGNQLDPRGLDPYFCAEDRVEYGIEIHITNNDGTERVYQFDPLRANALDAGMLMGGYKEMRDEIVALTSELEAKLLQLRSLGPSWLTDRLFVTDSNVPGWWFLPSTWNPLKGFGLFSRDREQYNRRWQEFDSGTRRRESIPDAASPLIINVTETMKRIRKQIIGEKESLERRQQRITYAVRNVDLPNSARTTVPDSVRSDAESEAEELQFPAIPDTSGMTRVQYDAFSVASINLYRQTLGLADGVVIDRTNRYLLRWRDLYAPLIPERYDARLFWYEVPPPFDGGRALPVDAVVRRLPQICTLKSKLQSAFGNTSVMKTIRVPHSAMSKREGAKSAVDAAVATWRNVTKTFRGMVWTVEPATSFGRPFAFHFVELAASTATGALSLMDSPSMEPFSWNTYLMVGSVSGLSIPGEIGRRVYYNERTPSAVTIQAKNSKGDPTADAAIMRSHKLVPSLMAWMALSGVADAIAYAALQHGTVFRLKDTLDNPVMRARQAAALAADIVRSAYGRTLQVSTLLPLNDLVWASFPLAGLAHAIVRRFVGLEYALRGRSSTASPDEFDKLWPAAERERATLFELSLRTLSRQTEFKLENWPFINMQSMIIQRTLLPIKNHMSALSGIEVQLQAAVASFIRVRRLVERACGGACLLHSFWALCDAVASRPITLQFAGYSDRANVLLINSLRRAQLGWRVPVAQESAAKFAPLVASRVASNVTSMADYQASTFESADDISQLALRLSISGIKSDNAMLVPPCGFGDASMTDIGDMHTLEDTITWLVPAADAMNNLPISVPGDTPISTLSGLSIQSWKMLVDPLQHPYQIEHLRHEVQGISRINARPVAGDVPYGSDLPGSVLEVLQAMYDRPATERMTGIYASRLRSMLWLVDRMIQLQMVANVRVDGNAGPQTALVAIEIDGYSTREFVFVAVAMAIARSLWATRYTSRASTVMVVPEGTDIPAIRQVLAQTAVILVGNDSKQNREDPLRAMPLCEVCHALVAILE